MPDSGGWILRMEKVGQDEAAFPFRHERRVAIRVAGIWDCWKSPEGKLLESCSILTTAPNDLVKDIHDRMPVILPQSHYEPWLTVLQRKPTVT